jgi:hypothetical protein
MQLLFAVQIVGLIAIALTLLMMLFAVWETNHSNSRKIVKIWLQIEMRI